MKIFSNHTSYKKRAISTHACMSERSEDFEQSMKKKFFFLFKKTLYEQGKF